MGPRIPTVLENTGTGADARGDIAQARRCASEAGKTVTIGYSVDEPNADGQTHHSRRDRIKGTRLPEIFR
jgi:hypothetical protein